MEASALKYSAGVGLPGRSPLLRLQSDERLIATLRRGNVGAFEVLVSRYETRLLAFCRHLLGSREDGEDVLQEVFAAAFNAILADERPINVRPWLYRIARNRSLNHMRRTQAIAVDTMDQHFAEHGASTADKVQGREEFRLLVGDIQGLPETQRTALVLREMDALSYEQIAEAMETTVSSVKSLLVRARVSLAEASEARLLSCEEVRMELAEVAEGLLKRPSPLVRRHLKECTRCATFRTQLKATNKALAALLPVGPLVVFRKLAFLHLGHTAGYGAGSTAGATAAGSTAGAALGASGAFGGGGVVSAGMSAVATKAAAGLAAAVIVTAGAVAVDHHHAARAPASPVASAPVHHAAADIAPVHSYSERPSTVATPVRAHHHAVVHRLRVHHATSTAAPAPVVSTPTASAPVVVAAPAPAPAPTTTTTTTTTTTPATAPGQTQTQTDPTTVPTATTPPAPPLSSPTTPAQPVTPAPVTGTGTAPVTTTPPATGTTPVTTTPPATGTTPVTTTPPPTETAPGTATTPGSGTVTTSAPTGTTPTGTTPTGTTTTGAPPVTPPQ